MYPDLPLEFLITGTAVSVQATAATRSAWKTHVRDTARTARGDGLWAFDQSLVVTIFYFPGGEMRGDIDNIVKPILDGLSRCIFIDDRQIERLVVQKFEPDNIFPFQNPSSVLAAAMEAGDPTIYVRVTDDPHEELRRWQA